MDTGFDPGPRGVAAGVFGKHRASGGGLDGEGGVAGALKTVDGAGHVGGVVDEVEGERVAPRGEPGVGVVAVEVSVSGGVARVVAGGIELGDEELAVLGEQ